ncbi:MAG: hypothetical protein JWN94_1261 [Betaproteobacteria bacterium]|nr:hypothetical protein [Betaproteobacteria bacterium]
MTKTFFDYLNRAVMAAMANRLRNAIVVLSIQSVFAGAALAQAPVPVPKPAAPDFKSEWSKQENIYRSEGDKVPSGYTIDRSLSDYVRALAAGFDSKLAALTPADRWLDIGAGRGQAILDYFAPEYDITYPEGRAQRGIKAQTVAMSIEDRRTVEWRLIAANKSANRLQYWFNRRLRDYTLQESGQFQLITDVIGGFSYSTDLSFFMEKVISMLATGGIFYSVLQDVRSEAGTNEPYYEKAPFLTEIVNQKNEQLSVCSWLKRITCVEVICESKKGWRPPVQAYQVQKLCSDVKVPALTPVHFESGTPPERRYQLQD